MGIFDRIKNQSGGKGSPPKDKNGVPYADSSSVADDERPYYQKDEYYSYYAYGDSDADRLITFEERKSKSYPSAGGLYVAEIMLLEYVSYGTYPKPSKGYPGFWWFQYGIRDIGHALESMAQRGFIQWASKENRVNHLTVAELKELLGRFQLQTSGSKAALLERIHTGIPANQLPDDLLPPKYELTEMGARELEENAYIPYMHKSQYKTGEGFGDLNVWSLNKAFKGRMPENWRQIVGAMEQKQFGVNICANAPEKKSTSKSSKADSEPASAAVPDATEEPKDDYLPLIFKEIGFRLFYHNFCVFRLNSKNRELAEGLPDEAKANCVLVYGYIDEKKGLVLEMIAAGKKGPKYYNFFPAVGKHRTIAPSEIENEEIFILDNDDGQLTNRFEKKIKALEKYNVPEELEKSRTLGFLDSCRDLYHPDIVTVLLLKTGLEPEPCKVRITSAANKTLKGELITYPRQNFGCKKGNEISFFPHKNEDDGSIVCLADMGIEEENNSGPSPEQFEDGSALEEAIKRFNADKNHDTYNYLLWVLSKSHVIIPCNIELSERAQEIAQELDQSGKNIDSLDDQTRDELFEGMTKIPQILTNNDKAFFPIFSNVESVEDKEAAQVDTSFIEAVQLTLSDDNLFGIVLNAFSDSIIFERDTLEAVLKSVGEEDDDSESECAPSERGESHSACFVSGNDNAPVALQVEKMDVFNFALYENGLEPIRGIKLFNKTRDVAEGLRIRVSADIDFFEPFEVAVPPVPNGRWVTLGNLSLPAKGDYLASLTEKVTATVTIQLLHGEDEIDKCRDEMTILAYDQSASLSRYAEYLPAFVLPNHPLIPALVHDASQFLAKWGKPQSIEGYQRKDPNRVRDLAAAAFAAIQKKNIVYCEPPASFDGQRIRTPETIMEQRLGTCMDMTLLYAACLETMGLHPVLCLIKGHIFCGFWLYEREHPSKSICIYNRKEIVAHIKANEMLFVECTAMCAGNKVRFDDVEYKATDDHFSEEEFLMAIDIFTARCRGIKPISYRVKEDDNYRIVHSDRNENEVTSAPVFKDIIVQKVEAGNRKMTKRDIWESKLLDLSSNNMLLSIPVNASVKAILSAHIDELEDALADGHEFRLEPVPEWFLEVTKGITQIKKEHSQEDLTHAPQWIKNWIHVTAGGPNVFEMVDWSIEQSDGRIDFADGIKQEFFKHRLYTFSDKKSLEKDLSSIYRVARTSQQENGVSSLYLGVGLLKWYEVKDGIVSKEPCYAPLVLIPIEMVRKSANQGYALHMRDEEPHFNLTLIQLLSQDPYNIEIGGLDPLPMDKHGVDIPQVFAIVRQAIMSIPTWDIFETCVFGNFSFSQFALWNDIHSNPDRLEKSNIVRSLMNGRVDFDCSLPPDIDEDPVYLPITVDSTQLHAIRMAAHGITFVLHGPPGTGKSQTITGMIANLMAKGKKVLFVAEKRVALEVVEKRLVSLGIGDFCMELHSDRASKKQVLSELEKAMKARFRYDSDAYERFSQRVARTRADLDEYVKSLHKKYKSGYSLHDLIDYYQSVQDADDGIQFSGDEAAELDAATINGHSDKIRSLIAAGKAVEAETFKVLHGVRFSEYSLDKRNQIIKEAREYSAALEKIAESSANLSKSAGIEVPQSYQDYEKLEKIAATIAKIKERDPIEEILKSAGVKGTSKYYLAKRVVTEEKNKLLANWKAETFDADIDTIVAQYEAASRKFFGRTSAINEVLRKIQLYSLQPLTPDDIPTALRLLQLYKDKEKAVQKEYDRLSTEEKEIVDRFAAKEDAEQALKNASETDLLAQAIPGGIESVNRFIQTLSNLEAMERFRANLEAVRGVGSRLNALLERTVDPNAENWIECESTLCRYLVGNPAELKDWALYNQIRNACLQAGLKPVVDAYEQGMPEAKIIPAYRKGLDYALINKIIYSDPVLGNFSGATFNDTIRRFKSLDKELLDATQNEIKRILGNMAPFDDESPVISRELAILRKAIQGGGRGLTIRSLFSMIPNILQRLCPCMLMNPDSVAQYLTNEVPTFDVVIFDEASQLPTCKAVGALSRAKNAVIVGDPKQMPPTSVGVKKSSVTDDFTLEDLDSILDDALALGVPSLHLQWHYRSTHESLIAFSNSQFYENKMYTFPSANDREQRVRIVYVDGTYVKNTNKAEAESIADEVVRRYYDPILRNQSIGIVTFNQKQMKLIEKLLEVRFSHDPGLDAWANREEDGLFVKNLENVQGDERDAILFSVTYGPDEKGHVSMNFGPINQDGGWKRLNVAFSRARVSMTLFSSLHPEMIDLSKSSAEGVEALKGFLKFAETSGTASYHPASESSIRKGTLKAICDVLTEAGYTVETMIGHSDFHVDIAIIDPYDSSRYILGILLDGDGYKLTENTRDREVAQIGVLNHLGWTIHRIWSIDWWDNRKKEISKLFNLLDALKERAKAEAEEKAIVLEEQKKAAQNAGAISDEQRYEEMEVMNEDDDDAPQISRIIDTDPGEEEKQTHEPLSDASLESETLTRDENLGLGSNAADVVDSGFDKEKTDTAAEADHQPEPSKPEENPLPSSQEEKPEPMSKAVPQYTLIDYSMFTWETEKLSPTEYVAAKNAKRIQTVISQILELEAPIERDLLIRRTFKSFGLSRSSAVVEATEKALKAVKPKNNKQNGIVYCWMRDQEPTAYMVIRGGESSKNARSVEEICQQEMKNAICYVLQTRGSLSKTALQKETSRVLGYQRMTESVSEAIEAGLRFAKKSGAISVEAGGAFAINKDNLIQKS